MTREFCKVYDEVVDLPEMRKRWTDFLEEYNGINPKKMLRRRVGEERNRCVVNGDPPPHHDVESPNADQES